MTKLKFVAYYIFGLIIFVLPILLALHDSKLWLLMWLFFIPWFLMYADDVD